MKKLNSILLIDDNIHDNYIHTYTIKKVDSEIEVIAVTSGEEALEYFIKHKHEPEKYPFPDLVFLDINMPGMNGFEFLQKAREDNVFDEENIKLVVMLTSSLNVSDEEMARNKFSKEILDFKNKPLTKEMLEELIEKCL